MLALGSRLALALIGCVIAGTAGAQPSAAQQQRALPPLNLVPSAPDALGRVPDHLVWLRPGLQSVQDPVDGQLVFINDDGHVVGRAALPPQFRIGRIVPAPDQVRLFNAQGDRQVVVDRRIDPGAVSALAASAVGTDRSPATPRIVRRAPNAVVFDSQRRAGDAPLEVRSITDGALAEVYEIGASDDGDRFIVGEEIADAQPLRVRVLVRRYSRSGALTGIAFVPLHQMDVVPRDFVTVTAGGMLRVLVPTANGVTIREMQFSPPGALPPRDGAQRDDSLRRLGRITRDIAIETNVPRIRGDRSFRPDGPRFRIRVATPPISREQVLAKARAYLSVNWTMTAENYARPGIDNLCQPQQARFWLRPIRFTAATIGKTIGPMPYKWGGDDTPESFRLRMDWGALAGDVCTCRDPALDYCLIAESAGVDCSGFVSRAWGIAKRGTAGLHDVASELTGLGQMRPGDAFNRPGRHVRLLLRREPGPLLSYTVLESALGRGCEGVCMRSYRPSELNGYRLIRYRGIGD